jgi:hypothetical protein
MDTVLKRQRVGNRHLLVQGMVFRAGCLMVRQALVFPSVFLPVCQYRRWVKLLGFLLVSGLMMAYLVVRVLTLWVVLVWELVLRTRLG